MIRNPFCRALYVLLCSLCLAGPASAQDASEKPFSGLCYGPFRNGQQPGGTYPSEAEMRQDLSLLKSLTGRIRTYGNESTLKSVPKLCAEVGVGCFVGAWIDTDKAANDVQVATAIAIATNNYATTRGFIIGNEYMLRNEQTAFAAAKTNLLLYIRRVKAATTVPVGIADGWNIWNNDFTKDLVAELDFVMMHVHPYWESQYSTPNLSINTAMAHVTNKYNLIAAKYPGKRIIIGETGWPSRGTQNYAAVPNEANQLRFMTEFTAWARKNNVEYFLFDAFDEAWKGTTNAEGSFGALTSTRPFTPKPGLLNLLTNRMAQTLQAVGPDLQLQVGTFEGNRYVLEQKVSLLPAGGWLTVSNFVGATGTNNSRIVIPGAGASNGFYRVKGTF